MLTLTLDLESEVPVYRQIALELRAKIARRELVPGDALPSVRELGHRLAVNLNTVAKAYRLLAAEGLVELRPGAGARVAAGEAPPVRPPSADDRRLLKHVIGQWASRGLDRKAVEASLLRAARDFFGKTPRAPRGSR